MKTFIAASLLAATILAGVTSPVSAGSNVCSKPAWVTMALLGHDG